MMLNGIRSVQDALGDIEAALVQRRDDQKRLTTEIAQLENAATALRAVAPLPGEAGGSSRKYRPVSATVRATAPDVAPAAPPAASAPAQYPGVGARRARVLSALSVRDDIRCAELARRLDMAQGHVQADLEKLLAQGFVERVGWGRWRRAAEEVVVFSGRDTLITPDAGSLSVPA